MLGISPAPKWMLGTIIGMEDTTLFLSAMFQLLGVQENTQSPASFPKKHRAQECPFVGPSSSTLAEMSQDQQLRYF